jgi:PAS domain S-box-containing protein
LVSEDRVMVGTELLDALPVAVYMTDAEGRITYYNQSAAELWGCRPPIGDSQWCGSWKLFRPDGRPLPHDQCPMAVSLREGRPVRGIEAIAERPDGSRVRFLPYPTPLRDASGRVVAGINLLMDVTESHASELQAAHLAAIVASSDDAIVSKTIDGRVTSWNAAAERLFGYTAAEMIGQPILRIIPTELHAEETRILAQLRRNERIDHFETMRVGKDGRRIDVSLTVSPLRDRTGQVIGASKVARDITERKQTERLQRLLIEELNHRVKNTLAMIQAIANQSMRHAKSPADFAAGFGGRIHALARAHDLLTQTRLQGAEIMDLLRDQVMLGRDDDKRIACAGPSLILEPQAAVNLALVLHELATNARKYGALSQPDGRLTVTWEIRSNGERHLLLEWKESGARKIAVPTVRGFGSSLIEQTLKAHGGMASIRYAAGGMSGTFTLPLPAQVRPNIALEIMAPKDTAAQHRLDDQPSLKGKRIILIEDEPLVAMDLESSLTAAGCEVVGTAGTLVDARALCASAQCDAALIDVNLGGQPSDELAAALTRRHIPFAFVTGYGREALPQGFRDAVVLTKPFDQAGLVATVELLVHHTADVVPLRSRRSPD